MRKKIILLIIAGVVIFFTFFIATDDDDIPAFCAGPGRLDPAPAITPATKASDPPGSFATTWPNNAGFKGRWASVPYDPDAPNYLVTVSHYDFGWQSYWLNTSTSIDYAKAKNRTVVFRLSGNQKVKITNVSGKGVVAGDGRSAYSCPADDGNISVTIHVEAGAAGEGEAGYLWGIDEGVGGSGTGVETHFEIGTP